MNVIATAWLHAVCLDYIPQKQTEQPEGDKDANNSAIKEDNAIDIDLTDPEVSAAATKIQANFRGHQIRQKLKDTPKVGYTGYFLQPDVKFNFFPSLVLFILFISLSAYFLLMVFYFVLWL